MTHSEAPLQTDPPSPPTVVPSARARETSRSLITLAACLVVASTSWFMLKELGPLLRPLILAAFLAYLIVPIQRWLARRIPAQAAAAVIVSGTLALFWGFAVTAYGNVVELNADLPRLLDRASKIVDGIREFGRAHLPRELMDADTTSEAAQAHVWHSIRSSMRIIVSNVAAMLAEAFVVGVYLVFLLMELGRFPRRIRAGFTPERADAILNVLARINDATTSYLRAKVLSSLATAIPTTCILWAFGVPYPVMWGILTFIGNFIPYAGSLIALSFPMLLAFLELEPLWRPCVVVLLLAVVQVVTNNFVEPTITGKAVDLSPLVTLIALAFWGLCWGVTGMLLAIPLTAMLKIVWENLAFTRPLAILMAERED